MNSAQPSNASMTKETQITIRFYISVTLAILLLASLFVDVVLYLKRTIRIKQIEFVTDLTKTIQDSNIDRGQTLPFATQNSDDSPKRAE